ncbi:hypothetical protein DYB32_010808 [Aphanomyces invadans]|uniref:MULE transposase domain-containing protein n=1 Tax=Aphanomyces invadans TaxID=157072 RepID=A0A418AF03_9STRA|nr:hypothetical protein DYB32_010808 [Aphanomyces invadans]
MSDDLRAWIAEDPKRMPKVLLKMLYASFTQGRYGEVAFPEQRQVQQKVNHIRRSELHHKSTVHAVESAMAAWVPANDFEDQPIHQPFVFGVEMVDGKACVGNGGLQAFRVGFTTIDMLQRYQAVCEDNPGVDIMCHMDTTFSTNKSGYPVFVFGYSDMAGSFHLLCVCITSQRTHEDVAWLLKALKEEFTRRLNFVWTPRLLMGDADKAQYLGMMTALQQDMPNIEYLMCFFHVIKKVTAMNCIVV